MNDQFCRKIFQECIDGKQLNLNSKVLAVCANISEKNFFQKMGFVDVVISNLDNRVADYDYSPFDYSYQDVQNLKFSDNSFDFVFVSAGLHHCRSPHRALLEMYRVSRIGVVVVEARDSAIMILANLLGLSPRFEIEAVVSEGFKTGGVDNTQIPNFIYRWTEREIKKVISSYNPTGRHEFKFFYELVLPFSAAKMNKTNLKFIVLSILKYPLKLLALLFKKQGNQFGMVILKPKLPADIFPWLKMEGDRVVFNEKYASEKFKTV